MKRQFAVWLLTLATGLVLMSCSRNGQQNNGSDIALTPNTACMQYGAPGCQPMPMPPGGYWQQYPMYGGSFVHTNGNYNGCQQHYGNSWAPVMDPYGQYYPTCFNSSYMTGNPYYYNYGGATGYGGYQGFYGTCMNGICPGGSYCTPMGICASYY